MWKLVQKLKQETHLQEVIQSRQRLDENVSAFVAKLIATGDEEIQSLVQVEVEVPVKVAANKLVNLLLRHGVKVLELVERGELLHVQAVRCYYVGLALQEMLCFIAGDLRHSREYVREIRGGTFETVSEDRCMRSEIGSDSN